MRNSKSSLDSILASLAFSSSSHFVLCSISNTGLQFNLANQRRQSGKVERYSDLLIHRNGSDAWEVDMAVGGEKRDQDQQGAANQGDGGLAIGSIL